LNEYFTTFTPQQLNTCKKILNYFICYAIQPVHSKTYNTTVKWRYSQNQRKKRKCVNSYILSYLYGSIFYKLEFRNTWIYTVEKENVVLTCGVHDKTETIEL